jgi:hypothetical protein
MAGGWPADGQGARPAAAALDIGSTEGQPGECNIKARPPMTMVTEPTPMATRTLLMTTPRAMTMTMNITMNMNMTMNMTLATTMTTTHAPAIPTAMATRMATPMR